MGRWSAVTLGEITDGLARYRPFVLMVAGVLLLAVAAPGERGGDEGEQATGQARPAESRVGEPRAASGDPDAGEDTAASETTAGAALPPDTSSGGAVPSRTAAAPGQTTVTQAVAAPDCDAATGRIAFPSKYAPPCVPLWPETADNGGATYRGVTRDSITVAFRQCPTNPATNAVLASAGIDDTPKDVRAMREGYRDLYNAHYTTYGRLVKFVYFDSGCSGDEEGRADALKVVSELEAFAVFDAFGAYAEELTARGVMNVTWVSTVQKHHLDRAPHEWSVYMTPEQQFTHVAEYIGKRLWARPAKWAGDATFHAQTRRFGLLYPDSATGEFRPTVEHLDRELSKYGARLHAAVGYTPGTAEAQEQARIAIARLKDAGVTSIVAYTDPITTIFLTQEATRQAFFPEWVLTGALLQDGNIFGRTFDQVQWSHAFGLSALSSRHSEELYEGYAPYVWHHGTPPPGRSAWHGFQPVMDLFMIGVHLAGPSLNPSTFRDGLWYRYPPTGGAAEGQVIILQWSFGDHGLWPLPDYSGGDDVKEIWWDPDATGKDEIGQEGKGMYREVDLGKRRTPGSWPGTEPRVFDRTNTSTYYDTYPPADDPGNPAHDHYKWEYDDGR